MGSLPGGGDPDYSLLATWETDSDNDLSGTGITGLDCYDSQVHDDSAVLFGATNTDATHYREVRSASGCSTPWAGKEGTGANFYNNTANVLVLSETYSRLRDLFVERTANGAGAVYAIYLAQSYCKAINIVFEANNEHVVGSAYGAYLYNGIGKLVYNCINKSSKNEGFRAYHVSATYSTYFVCCVSGGASTYGFNSQSATGTTVVWSCYAANCGTDFRESNWDAPSGWNSSKDNTSDLGGAAGNNYKNSNDLITSGKLDADFLPTEHISWAGGAGDNAGRNPYDDLSAVEDFDGFFKDGAAGESISKKDIRGADRPNPDTADVSWDIGAGEYVIEIIEPDEPFIELVCDAGILKNILTPNEPFVELICDPGRMICCPKDVIIRLICDHSILSHFCIDWSIASTAYRLLVDDFTAFVHFYGARNGQRCSLILKQDGTGNRDVSLPDNVRGGDDIAVPLVLSENPNTEDYVMFIYRESIDKYDILSFIKGYSSGLLS